MDGHNNEKRTWLIFIRFEVSSVKEWIIYRTVYITGELEPCFSTEGAGGKLFVSVLETT